MVRRDLGARRSTRCDGGRGSACSGAEVRTASSGSVECAIERLPEGQPGLFVSLACKYKYFAIWWADVAVVANYERASLMANGW